MEIHKPNYVSFMVRLWQEQPGGGDWLAQVEHIPGGEKRYFGSVEALVGFIRTATQSAGAPAKREEITT